MDQRKIAWALALVLFAALYRIVSAIYIPSLPNFAPVMAMAFCAGLALPGISAFLVPIGAIFVSDLLLNAHYGQALVDFGMLAGYACYLCAAAFGVALRGRGWSAIVSATVANSVLFYLVTNSLSWLNNPQYAQSFAGWIQALTVGLPGFPPTWAFFRNSLVSDVLFTALFVGLLYRPAQHPVAVEQRAH